MKAKAKQKRKTSKILPHDTFKKGAVVIAKAVETTRIPQGYSVTKAWFADRMILYACFLLTVAFSSGVLYTLYLSQPIGESRAYEVISSKARFAQEGIMVLPQQMIDIASPLFGSLIRDNRDEGELLAEQLAARKEKLKAYLASKNSPFSEDEAALDAFINSKNMKLMVAISFVESTFGKHCYYYNCSGIGGTPPSLRKYGSYAEWIADFDDLLERRYKDMPVEKFVGLYVQPGSPSWIYGVKQVLAEFEVHGIEG
jgi:hypothetical protein